MNATKMLFAQAVFEGKTNKAAAIAANLSPKTAEQAGARLAKDKEVIEYVNRLRLMAESGQQKDKSDPIDNFSSQNWDVITPADGEKISTETIMREVDKAMSQDKSRGRGNCDDIPDMDESDIVIIPPCGGDPQKFLEALLDNNLVDVKTRVDAAKALMPYKYRKLGEMGKKELKDEAAKGSVEKFAPRPAPVKAA